MSSVQERRGFTLLETILFFAIVAVMSFTIVAVFLSTQDARIRQRSIAQVEQESLRLLDTMTRTIRYAEAVLAPSSGHSASILALQMAGNADQPTMLATLTGTALLVQKTGTAALVSSSVRIRNLTFTVLAPKTVTFSFDAETTIPTAVPIVYARHFAATVTLFPDDDPQAGGCTECPIPACTNDRYRWSYCASGVCTPSPTTLPCQST